MDIEQGSRRSCHGNVKYTHTLQEAAHWILRQRSCRHLKLDQIRAEIKKYWCHYEWEPVWDEAGEWLRNEQVGYYQPSGSFEIVARELPLRCLICENRAWRTSKRDFAREDSWESHRYKRDRCWHLLSQGRVRSDRSWPLCKACAKRFISFFNSPPRRTANWELEEWLSTAWVARRLQRFQSEAA